MQNEGKCSGLFCCLDHAFGNLSMKETIHVDVNVFPVFSYYTILNFDQNCCSKEEKLKEIWQSSLFSLLIEKFFYIFHKNSTVFLLWWWWCVKILIKGKDIMNLWGNRGEERWVEKGRGEVGNDVNTKFMYKISPNIKIFKKIDSEIIIGFK